jgi:phage tail sheath gpL-like
MVLSSSRGSRAVGIDFEYVNLASGVGNFLPQRIAVFGQGTTLAQATYSNTKKQVTSAKEAGDTYGYGSPIHSVVAALLPVNGDGVGDIPVTIYPMDDAATGAISAGSITPSGTATAIGTYQVLAGNIRSATFSIAASASVADVTAAMETAINANVDMPIIATDGTTVLDTASKWDGLTGDDVVLEVVRLVNGKDEKVDLLGNVFAIVQPTAGANNPTVDAGIAQIGNVWESMVINCLGPSDSAAKVAFNTWGEGRWEPLVNKPAVVFAGDTQAAVASAIAIPDANKTDRVNSQLVNPGSNDLPWVVAARQVARIAKLANDNPAHDYGSQAATGLVPGLDSQQWTIETEMETAFDGGSSTITSKDGVVYLSDTLTYYHPTGDPLPAYRYVVDIVKLQQVGYRFDVEFNSAKWDGAPLLAEADPTVNPTAKKPSTFVAAAASVIDGLVADAILADAATIKSTITAEIDAANPKRVNLSMTIKLSGNTNIIDIPIKWGFNFG